MKRRRELLPQYKLILHLPQVRRWWDPSNLLPQDNFKAHQNLLKQVASNLGLEAEELRETSHSLMDILAAAAPAKIVLPINEAVIGLVRQTPSFLTPTSKRTEKKYYVPQNSLATVI